MTEYRKAWWNIGKDEDDPSKSITAHGVQFWDWDILRLEGEAFWIENEVKRIQRDADWRPYWVSLEWVDTDSGYTLEWGLAVLRAAAGILFTKPQDLLPLVGEAHPL